MKKQQFRNYLITILICLGINVLVILYETSEMGFKENALRILSDGFFISGLLIFMFSVLCFVANEGGLNAFGYVAKNLTQKLKRNNKKKMSYLEYVREKQMQGKIELSHMFIVSIVSILFGLLFALI